MRFSQFFNSWLNDGYYKKAVKIGKNGDFFTSVSVGSLFGVILSRYILSISSKFDGKISIVEIGANEGYLLADIIQGIFTFSPKSLSKFEFVMVEPHENLRLLQRANFKEFFGDEISLTHYKSLKDAKFKNAIFISNELFDSFACEVVDGEKMLYVGENLELFWDKIDPEIKDFAKKYEVKKGEIPLKLYEFFTNLSASASKFHFITFDYGDMGSRGDITLRIYDNHRVYNLLEEKDLSKFYKNSDITYDLNFEIFKSEFLKVKGVKFISFKKQSVALMDMGASEVLSVVSNSNNKNAYKNATLQLKRLIYEFGSRFKAIEFSKGV
ncbi:SAM-dependent methyltransferase [Campylobacter corcagiensis]|uniref:SAM-dependent methyltransferase n=1 Tax=Campylobacter corcagiensis TaxID=1448857 RepID=A0A7M1LF98_9BACT|nr:SAM-dependent methyltransferase [Campylobacter corcagiensis]QKF64827.1 SAM-dependent methyltransferase, MidA family [Campylobacter corcagiensis]QOQ87011.1 SAM-dependent methyltransferase [Campylobacter corcagiensis]